MPAKAPRKEADRKRQRVLRSIPFSPVEFRAVKRAADRAGVPFSRYVREAACMAAKEAE